MPGRSSERKSDRAQIRVVCRGWACHARGPVGLAPLGSPCGMDKMSMIIMGLGRPRISSSGGARPPPSPIPPNA